MLEIFTFKTFYKAFSYYNDSYLILSYPQLINDGFYDLKLEHRYYIFIKLCITFIINKYENILPVIGTLSYENLLDMGHSLIVELDE